MYSGAFFIKKSKKYKFISQYPKKHSFSQFSEKLNKKWSIFGPETSIFKVFSKKRQTLPVLIYFMKFFVQGISEKYQSLQVRVPLNILRYPKVAVKAVSSVYLSIEFTNKILLILCFNYNTNIYLKIFLSNFYKYHFECT